MQHHALIVMSHGTGGMALNSYDTAMALAEAGFVVAAVTHTGDNYQDHSVSFTKRNFISRPAQISRVIDFMLSGWTVHAAIDPHRIGVLWSFRGRATALVVGGGVGDWQRALDFCKAHPDDWGCARADQGGGLLVGGHTADGGVAAADAEPELLLEDPDDVGIVGVDGGRLLLVEGDVIDLNAQWESIFEHQALHHQDLYPAGSRRQSRQLSGGQPSDRHSSRRVSHGRARRSASRADSWLGCQFGSPG